MYTVKWSNGRRNYSYSEEFLASSLHPRLLMWDFYEIPRTEQAPNSWMGTHRQARPSSLSRQRTQGPRPNAVAVSYDNWVFLSQSHKFAYNLQEEHTIMGRRVTDSSSSQKSSRSDTVGTFSLFVVFKQLPTTPHVASAHARLSRPVGCIGPYNEPLAECQRHFPGGYRANCRARISNLSIARCSPYPRPVQWNPW